MKRSRKATSSSTLSLSGTGASELEGMFTKSSSSSSSSLLPSTGKENTKPSALEFILNKGAKRTKVVPFHWTEQLNDDKVSQDIQEFMENTCLEYIKNLVQNFSIDESVHEASWKALQYCLMHDQDEELMEKNFAVVCSSAIHIASLSSFALADSAPRSPALGYSYLLNADKLVRKKSPDGLVHVYCEFLVTFSLIFKLLRPILSETEVLFITKEETALTQNFVACHKSFEAFKFLFDIFFQFHDKQSKYFDYLYKYVWLLYCDLAGTATPDPRLEMNQDIVIVCSTVSFIATQVDQEYRASAEKIADELIKTFIESQQEENECLDEEGNCKKNHKICALMKADVLDKMRELRLNLENDDLINNIERIRKLIAYRYNINPKIYIAADVLVIERITKETPIKSAFKYNEVFKPFMNMPWPIYLGVMDSGTQAPCLIFNLITLIDDYDSAINSKRVDFDGRIFLPEIKRPLIPTGRKGIDEKTMRERLRVSKLAMMSVALKSKTQVGFNYRTPVHCKDFVRKLKENRTLTQAMSFQQIEQKVLKMMDDPDVFFKNHKHIPYDPPMCAMIKGIVKELKENENGERLDLSTAYMIEGAVKLMFYLIDRLYEWYRTKVPSEEYAILLLYSDRFYRALLAVSCEILRFVYQLRTWNFEHILGKVKARCMDIALVIPQVIQIEKSWIPLNIVRRLKEIEADVYDHSAWMDPGFVDVHCYSQGIKSTNNPEKNELLRFFYYTLISTEEAKSKSVNWKEIHAAVGQGFNDMLVLLMDSRIKQLMRNLELDNKLVHEKSRFILDQIIMNENDWKVLAHRHLDNIIICSFMLAQKSLNLGFSLTKIFAEYKLQPQYVTQTAFDVYGREEGHTLDLNEFYNEHFLEQISDVLEKL